MEEKESIVVLEFWAPWLSYCQKMESIYNDVSEVVINELVYKIKIFKVNTDIEESLAMKYEINTIPTFLIFKDGDIIEKLVGFFNKKELIEKITNKINK